MCWWHLTLWTVSCAAVLRLKLGEIRSYYMSFTMTENHIRRFILAQIELNQKETIAPEENPSVWTTDYISKSSANTKDRTKTTMVKYQHVNHLANELGQPFTWTTNMDDCVHNLNNWQRLERIFSNRSTSLQNCSWKYNKVLTSNCLNGRFY